ncbi:hypothetical protein F5I97DRAFT_1440247 [Phlebopus sp. FC_14]|nr:hypothetical protein F5I97DRAFT_1440247 [Phlebopus sp. FC_14]
MSTLPRSSQFLSFLCASQPSLLSALMERDKAFEFTSLGVFDDIRPTHEVLLEQIPLVSNATKNQSPCPAVTGFNGRNNNSLQSAPWHVQKVHGSENCYKLIVGGDPTAALENKLVAVPAADRTSAEEWIPRASRGVYDRNVTP